MTYPEDDPLRPIRELRGRLDPESIRRALEHHVDTGALYSISYSRGRGPHPQQTEKKPWSIVGPAFSVRCTDLGASLILFGLASGETRARRLGIPPEMRAPIPDKKEIGHV